LIIDGCAAEELGAAFSNSGPVLAAAEVGASPSLDHFNSVIGSDGVAALSAYAHIGVSTNKVVSSCAACGHMGITLS